jgi:PTS system N-acetylglucosamine-specific IIC component
VLTGVAMAVMNALDIKLGFTFSAGLFDYVLNFGKATRPLWLIPLGLAYGGIYYGLFRFFIVRFDLKTPGREADDETGAAALAITGGGRGADFVAALGGAANLVSVDACTTRLRLIVADQAAVREPALRALGARGLVRPSDKALQVVLGPIADQVAGEIRAAAAVSGGAPAPARPAAALATADPSPADNDRAQALVAALGGAANVETVTPCSSRLRLLVRDNGKIDDPALQALAPRGVVHPRDRVVHLVLGPDAERIGVALRRLLPG